MKKVVNSIIIVLSAALIFAACNKDDNPTNPGPAGGPNYYPNGNGTYYKYAVEKTDSNGTQQSGTRSSKYDGTQSFAGVTYQIQYDTVDVAGASATNKFYFRKSDAGVYFFADTTGISASVPDTLLQYLKLDSNEFALFSFPFTGGKTWTIFKLSIVFGAFNLPVIEVTGSYVGDENISLNLTSGTVTKNAAKVKFTLKLTIPNPDNIFQTTNKSYDAYAWLVENVGVARWEGNAAILNTFGGTGIDLGDTTTVVSQSLINYSIK